MMVIPKTNIPLFTIKGPAGAAITAVTLFVLFGSIGSKLHLSNYPRTLEFIGYDAERKKEREGVWGYIMIRDSDNYGLPALIWDGYDGNGIDKNPLHWLRWFGVGAFHADAGDRPIVKYNADIRAGEVRVNLWRYDDSVPVLPVTDSLIETRHITQSGEGFLEFRIPEKGRYGVGRGVYAVPVKGQGYLGPDVNWELRWGVRGMEE